MNLTLRSTEPELLDSADFRGVELERALRDIARFNRWLGGNRSLISGVRRALRILPQRPLTVVDVGCGGGDGLRALARWSVTRGVGLNLHGIDSNPSVIEVARRESRAFPGITFVVGDAFGSDVQMLKPDIVIANQFLHHFTSGELQRQLPKLLCGARALVVTDLHRHALAHTGFGVLAKLFRASEIALHDGQVSIRRGFTREELLQLTQPLALSHRSIVWACPFRFEVVLVP